MDVVVTWVGGFLGGGGGHRGRACYSGLVLFCKGAGITVFYTVTLGGALPIGGGAYRVTAW